MQFILDIQEYPGSKFQYIAFFGLFQAASRRDCWMQLLLLVVTPAMM